MKYEAEHNELSTRYQAAWSLNQTFIPLLLEATYHALPNSYGLNVLYHYNNDSSHIGKFLASTTAQIECNRRANNLQAMLCPVKKRWGGIYSMNSDGTRTRHEMLTNQISDAIENSNFHTKTHSFFMDLCISTAALWVTSPSDDQPLLFENLPGSAFIEELGDDKYKAYFWTKAMSVAGFESEYGKIPEGYQAANNTVWVTCSYRRVKRKQGDIWRLIECVDGDFSMEIRRMDKPYNQLIVVDDSIRAGEARSRGVVITMIEDIKYLNLLEQGIRNYSIYSAKPMLLIGKNMPSNFRLRPNQVIKGGIMNQEDQVRALVYQLPLQTLMEEVQSVTQKIRTAFNTQPYGAVTETPVRTATEMAMRERETQRQEVSDTVKIMTDFNISILDCVMHILSMRGLVEVPPNAQIEFDSQEVNIQNAEDINSVIQYSQIIGQVMGPQAIQMFIDPPSLSNYLVNTLNVPSEILASSHQSQQQAQSLMQSMQQGQGGPSESPVQPQQPQEASAYAGGHGL